MMFASVQRYSVGNSEVLAVRCLVVVVKIGKLIGRRQARLEEFTYQPYSPLEIPLKFVT